MAGGGAGAGSGSEVFNGAGVDSTMADNFGGTPATTQNNSSYYNSLVRPGTAGETVSNLYQSVLGRAPEAGAQDWWANQAKTQNWTARDLAQNFKGGAAAEILNSTQGQAAYLAARPDVAQNWQGTPLEHYMQYGINEPHATGTALDRLNPQAYSNSQTYTRPSAYNTNPVGVDYANIFNPTPMLDSAAYLRQNPDVAAAVNRGLTTAEQHYADYGRSEGRAAPMTQRSVLSNQQTMTPQQQASYLDEWAQDYSRSNRAATQAANQARINTANTQWEAYLKDKASREAQAKIDEAVKAKEAEWERNYNNNNNNVAMTAVGKAGGSVPGGLRSLRGK